MNIIILHDQLVLTELANYLYLLRLSLLCTSMNMQRVYQANGSWDELDEFVEKRNALLQSKLAIENSYVDYLSDFGRLN